MEILSLGRAGGKTHKMIEAIEQYGNSLLVVATTREKERIGDLLEARHFDRFWGCANHDHFRDDINLLRRQIVTPSEARNRVRTSPNAMVFVDNLDLILWETFGRIPISVTMSEPVKLRTTL